MTGALERKKNGKLVINHQVIDYSISDMFKFCKDKNEADFLKIALMKSLKSGYDEFVEQERVKFLKELDA